MILTVRRLYIPVVFTIVGVLSVGCSGRRATVVANALNDATYIGPESNAYDTKEWALSMTDRDARRAGNIARWKAELWAKSHLNFFPPDDQIFRDVLHENAWFRPDRDMIRGYLKRILVTTEQRRRFEDDDQLAADSAQARRMLNAMNRFDNLGEI